MKTNPGNFFEDFHVGMTIRHATPRTLNQGDVALYQALTGSRFVVHSSSDFARAVGFREAPVDDLLVFHVVFGKTVPDISLNAVANLGYADVRFAAAVYPGDTLRAETEIIGLKENSNGKTGVVYVRSRGVSQNDETVLSFVRWVMVNKRDRSTPTPHADDPSVPDLPDAVLPDALERRFVGFQPSGYDVGLAGSSARFGDYQVGERIDHVDGMTIEEAEHQMATRLYQNTAKVHFNHQLQQATRFARRLIYGGHVFSLARALSFNGLANAFRIAAINAGAHVAPCFAGDTVYAWSEVLDRTGFDGEALGALRLRTVATKDVACDTFPLKEGNGYSSGVILDLDYWVLIPN